MSESLFRTNPLPCFHRVEQGHELLAELELRSPVVDDNLHGLAER